MFAVTLILPRADPGNASGPTLSPRKQSQKAHNTRSAASELSRAASSWTPGNSVCKHVFYLFCCQFSAHSFRRRPRQIESQTVSHTPVERAGTYLQHRCIVLSVNMFSSKVSLIHPVGVQPAPCDGGLLAVSPWATRPSQRDETPDAVFLLIHPRSVA
jgi:hypothetical protein